MDIKLTDSLLRTYLKTNAKPAQLAEALSLCGPTVDRMEKVGDDWVYDIEVITNRVDAASAYGIAREAAAILPEFNYTAELVPLNLDGITSALQAKNLPPLDIEIINNPQLNHRILAVKISQVTIKPSPEWMQTQLELMGQRPLNNMIDVTNLVTFELGHPIHVFDYDRLTTKKIIVREAAKGETIVTLDDKTHVMQGGEVVYDDGSGNLIDLPGIMGTANSVVTDQTKNVLLWIEDNNGKKIRSASLAHQIRTHAAMLNEKKVDPELSYPAILRAAELMLELGGGKVGSRLLDIYPKPVKTRQVELDLAWLAEFVGVAIPMSKVIDILTRLGFTVKSVSNTIISVAVPSWRAHDITIKEDLAEEITRVYGYFRLPSILPVTQIPAVGTEAELSIEMKSRNQLARLGYTEVYNSSLISAAAVKLTGIQENQLFKLSNPLSEDYIYLRPSLIPSLTANVLDNRGLVNPPYKLFELSHTYHPLKDEVLANETPTLGMASVGLDFRHLKGDLDELFRFLHQPYRLEPLTRHPFFSDTKAGQIIVGKHPIGVIGYPRPEMTTSLHLPETLLMAELDFHYLAGHASLIHRFQPIPEYPPVIEDLTFTIPEKTPVGPIMAELAHTDPLIEKVDLKTIYRQNYTFTLTYRNTLGSLSATEVGPIRKKAVTSVYQHFKAALVGTLD